MQGPTHHRWQLQRKISISSKKKLYISQDWSSNWNGWFCVDPLISCRRWDGWKNESNYITGAAPDWVAKVRFWIFFPFPRPKNHGNNSFQCKDNQNSGNSRQAKKSGLSRLNLRISNLIFFRSSINLVCSWWMATLRWCKEKRKIQVQSNSNSVCRLILRRDFRHSRQGRADGSVVGAESRTPVVVGACGGELERLLAPLQ